MTFGHYMRTLRLERKLTQDGVAEAAGISKPYLSNIETGRAKNPPSPAVLVALARALGIHPKVLAERARWERLPVEVQCELTTLRNQRDHLRDLLEANPASIPPELRALLDASAETKHRQGKAATKTTVHTAHKDTLATLTGCDDGEFVTVTTDTMAPAYCPGDVIVVSPSRPSIHGCDCLAMLAGEHTATLYRYFDDGDRIRLQPANPAYPPRFCQVSDITTIASVLCRIELRDTTL